MSDRKKKIEISAENGETIHLTLTTGAGEEPDIDEMNEVQLEAYLAELEEVLDRLDADEPEDDSSDAYEEWADRHEELEDLIDDVKDRLDELCE